MLINGYNAFMFDYLVVGAGLFGSVFAYEASKRGKRCLVLDKRKRVGGNLYTENRDGINIHLYGAHIFHTSNKSTWDYFNSFSSFNNYINSPVANYKGRLYNLPFNMNTFYELWGDEASTPEKAKRKIESQRLEVENPANLEETALSLAGRDIYEILIKGYTEKQWGREAKELPSEIIKRIPLRFTFNNNYFSDFYQGIPIGGYTQIIEKMLSSSTVVLESDFNEERKKWEKEADRILYTGSLDALFDYNAGELEFRSEKFEHERLEEENHQGVAVMNYTDSSVPYTRVIEHKHFEGNTSPFTWISREYSVDYRETKEPYYPINDKKNSDLYALYKAEVQKKDKYIIGGRLAEYRYYDMDKTVESALSLVKKEFGEEK